MWSMKDDYVVQTNIGPSHHTARTRGETRESNRETDRRTNRWTRDTETPKITNLCVTRCEASILLPWPPISRISVVGEVPPCFGTHNRVDWRQTVCPVGYAHLVQGCNRCRGNHQNSGVYAWGGHNAAMSPHALHDPAGVCSSVSAQMVDR